MFSCISQRTQLKPDEQELSEITTILGYIQTGVPDQIFGVIDDSWDDDDLPVPLDMVQRLALSYKEKGTFAEPASRGAGEKTRVARRV